MPYESQSRAVCSACRRRCLLDGDVACRRGLVNVCRERLCALLLVAVRRSISQHWGFRVNMRKDIDTVFGKYNVILHELDLYLGLSGASGLECGRCVLDG